MKKNVLLILLSSFLLAGCTLDLGFIKIGGDTNAEEDGKNNGNSHENNDNSVDPGDNQNVKPELNSEYNVTISLAGTSFCESVGIKGTGFQINANGGAQNKAKFDSYLTSCLEYSGLLTETVCAEMNTAQYGSSFCICVGTRNDNSVSGFDSGTFTWKSVKSITKVEVKAKGYYKAAGAKDVNAHLSIDQDDHSLEYDASSEPAYQLLTKEYSAGTTSFTLTSSAGRVTLEEISITWRT